MATPTPTCDEGPRFCQVPAYDTVRNGHSDEVVRTGCANDLILITPAAWFIDVFAVMIAAWRTSAEVSW